MPEEKVYTIPLRKAYRKSVRRRVPYSVRLIEDYVKRHTKSKEVKMGKHLNDKLWEHSITKPPRRVRVKVVKDGTTAKAELMGFDYVEFKAKPKTEKVGMKEKLMGRLGPKAAKKEEEEKKIEGKEEAVPGEKKEETKKEEVKEGQKETPTDVPDTTPEKPKDASAVTPEKKEEGKEDK